MAEEATEHLDWKARARHLQDLARSWLRQRKRERAAKKKAGSQSGLAMALIAALVILLVGFGFCLKYVFSTEAKGKALGIDQVMLLAEQGRIDKATILD